MPERVEQDLALMITDGDILGVPAEIDGRNVAKRSIGCRPSRKDRHARQMN